jgi:hypothetical protein
MLDALFSASFGRGRDLRRIDELVALAGEVDLDPLRRGRRRRRDGTRAPSEPTASSRRIRGREHPDLCDRGAIRPSMGAKRSAVLLEALRKAGGAQK